MTIAYIGLGSNLGDRKDNLNRALELLREVSGVKVSRVAPFYCTEPVGFLEQEWFLNTVAEINTSLSACELLDAMLKIEDKLGRVRTVRWGPRIIDLDLLIYGNERINKLGLSVPHPHLKERAFVLVPLATLNPSLVLPGGERVDRLAEALREEQRVYCFDED